MSKEHLNFDLVTALLAARGQAARGYPRAGPAAVPEVISGGKERTTFSQLPPALGAEGYGELLQCPLTPPVRLRACGSLKPPPRVAFPDQPPPAGARGEE